jgi:hypothetical protein
MVDYLPKPASPAPAGLEPGEPAKGESPIDRAAYAQAMHRRQMMRRAIVLAAVIGLLLAAGVLAVPVIRQMTIQWSLRSSGFIVDWQLDSENWANGGVTAVAYKQNYWISRTGDLDAELRRLPSLWNLESLQLGECDVTEQGLAPLSSLGQLRELSLMRLNHIRYGGGLQGLSDVCLTPIQNLTNLETLTLTGNRITDSGLAKLAGLTKLEALDLDATDVTDAGLVHLQALRQLKTVGLAGTGVTPEGVKKLKAALPELDIDLAMEPTLADQLRSWRRQKAWAPKSRPPGTP